ncbi:MAG: hypothetical protein H0T89_34900 [Deltaproteobacteria bacterium]|nr:hypothetical protein [Deltaproteobacteria bacterium]MDQ3297527.1 hypothetical protein [Myxococcota bacterium]
MWKLLAITLVGCGLAGCGVMPVERPQATLVCHNANCAGATEPTADNTLAALDASLALQYRGRPAIDGMEVDTLWDRSRSTCIFAHHFGQLAGPPALGMDAAERVATHLLQSGPVSWSGDRFFIKIELKAEVLIDGTSHSDEEVGHHLACVFDMADRIIAAARQNSIALELGFDSEKVSLLRAITKHARWPGKEPFEDVSLRLIANVASQGLEPTDLPSLQGDSTSEGVDVLAFHATRIPTKVVDDYAALGATLMLWMQDAAPETLDAMRTYEPRYVVTNEATLFRRWGEQ